MSAAKAAFATLVIRAFSISAQLGFFILLARMSSIEVVGLFAISSSFWVLSRALLPMGWNIAVLRRVSVWRAAGRHDHCLTLLKRALFETAGVGVMFTALLVIMIWIFDESNVLSWALASVVGILWAGIGILVSYLRAVGELVWSQVCDGVIIYLVPFVVSVGLTTAKATFGLNAIMATYVASAFLSVICLLAVLVRRRVVTLEKETSPLDIRLERQLAHRLWWNQAFSALSGRASVVLAAPVAGIAATAIIETGLRTQLVGATLAWAGGTVAGPRYAVAHEEKGSNGARLLSVVTWAALFPSLAVVALLLIWGEPILGILGPAFVSERIAITLMALAAVVELPASSGGYFLMMTGRERLASTSTVVQLVILIACVYALGTMWGSLGIAVGVLVAASVRSGLVLLGLRRERVTSPLSIDGLTILVAMLRSRLRFGS